MKVVEITQQGIPRLGAASSPALAQPRPAQPSTYPPIKYKCRHCKAVLETNAAMGMKKEPCPLCHEMNTVPPSKEQQREKNERQKALERQRKEQKREEAAKRAEAERLKRRQEVERRKSAETMPSLVLLDEDSSSLAVLDPMPVPTASQVKGRLPKPANYSVSAGSFVGNLLWFIFGGGMAMGFGWLVLGAVMCCTVIGVPFGIAAFRIAGFAAFPFGKQLVDVRLLGESRMPGTALANLLWVILAGLWLAIGHALAGVACLCAFIFVFPVFGAFAHFNLAAASFAPLGKRAVPKAYAQALIQAAAQGHVLAAPVAVQPSAPQCSAQPLVGDQGIVLSIAFGVLSIILGLLGLFVVATIR